MGKSLLWIEDDAKQLKHYVSPLQREGWTIQVASSVRDGLAALTDIERFSVILLDLLLPARTPQAMQYDHPGIALLEHIRRELMSDIPVVVFTVVWTPDEIERIRELGVSAILNKPLAQRRLRFALYEAANEQLPPEEILPEDVPNDWR